MVDAGNELRHHFQPDLHAYFLQRRHCHCVHALVVAVRKPKRQEPEGVLCAKMRTYVRQACRSPKAGGERNKAELLNAAVCINSETKSNDYEDSPLVSIDAFIQRTCRTLATEWACPNAIARTKPLMAEVTCATTDS